MEKWLCVIWLNICLFCGSKGVIADSGVFTAGVEEISPQQLLREFQIEQFSSALLDLKLPSTFDVTMFRGNFSCHFKMVTEIIDGVPFSEEYYKYRISAVEGHRTNDKNERNGYQFCALHACANSSLNSCNEHPSAEDIDPRLIFKNITIDGNFTKSDELFLMPLTQDVQLNPLPDTDMLWNNLNMSEHYEATLTTTQTQKNILFFGIYGHYNNNNTSSAMSNVLITNFKFLMILFIIIKLFHVNFKQ